MTLARAIIAPHLLRSPWVRCLPALLLATIPVAPTPCPLALGQTAATQPQAISQPTDPTVALPADGYDFGLTKKGSVHKIRLLVPNPANQGIRVTRVRSECKCLAGTVTKESYTAGESILVTVTFTAPAETTRYNMRLVLLTDHPQHKIIPVRIKADVDLPLWVKPPPIRAEPPSASQLALLYAEVVNRGDTPVRLLYSSSSVRGCVALVPREPIAAGAAARLAITLGPVGMAATCDILVATDCPTQPDLLIRVDPVAPRPPRPETRSGSR